VPVIAGAGSNSTAEAIELVAHAKAVGADAALVVTPYYNRPSQEGVYQHYKAINDAVQLPVLVYNVPGSHGRRISPTRPWRDCRSCPTSSASRTPPATWCGQHAARCCAVPTG
jgi:dihydrodipicolinate synthase/N-acetylneuraminate lyase